jgi:hypothetical protein
MEPGEREFWIGWTFAVLLLIVGTVAAVWYLVTN